MTTTPPQSPHDPYAAQPGAGGGYGPPQDQFPQYTQPQPGQPQYDQPQYGQPGVPPSGQPQDQPQFGQGFPQQGQQPQGMPAYPQGAIQCRFCGGMPAVQATVRGHQGFLIMMRFLKLEGPFCRTCGIATVRNMTAKSLWQGWWGIGSSIINPITMLINIPTRLKFKQLPEPMPGAPGQPMDMGKPLFLRPAILGFLLPIAVIALLIWSSQSSPSSAGVGDCIQNKGTISSPNVKVVDCGSGDAEYKVVGKLSDSTNSDQCEQFEGYTVAYTEEGRSSGYTLCLAPK
ncbi:toxin-antitoxin system, toxin component [Kribbella qitaiheensis]|uniref:Toxin-antitoxin system, toxin component n=1 Tax=Kribbella qitaiheensis TaxID=1544730 RepID=A0A7G6WTH0_9ACTN|nr:toxin-antitoxin system, toxin component [Kribbella qitaiheensis]QNE17285.1 toxin-antitoxin system, toxin component [Kribbella qitaiheensis]